MMARCDGDTTPCTLSTEPLIAASMSVARCSSWSIDLLRFISDPINAIGSPSCVCAQAIRAMRVRDWAEAGEASGNREAAGIRTPKLQHFPQRGDELVAAVRLSQKCDVLAVRRRHARLVGVAG